MSRTVLYAIVNLIVALLAVAGIELPAELVDTLRDNLEAALAAALALNGIVVWVLRARTRTPLAGLVRKEPTP